ncbi:MAG: hypothetical protein CFH15_00846 [Alphaproteobacteria bacterium MarineAlpha5_Bin5]|nr:MAG: hypothetical protein CFH15_00846 [Alphaproteobacteria bacterium MarineAlpha5_Bin5]PPR51305.1 MAG: hypothetical protein CFH14_00738 [Alphaproteobacteria bacterium MarineAlpha5_Bin4]|tara:strand:+ start:640 stop:768 length:129 start_codon:yes stop_codon:yes gene_type:complete
MKNTYIALFLLILIVFLSLGLYFVDIPAPAKFLIEDYNLIIK